MRYHWESTEDIIKRLESELYSARSIILNLLPMELHELLSSYYSCQSITESKQWERMVIEKLLDYVAEKFTDNEDIIPYNPRMRRERAKCPLCGSGPQGGYEESFAFPEGLRRHFEGYGNTMSCSVLEHIHSMAREYFRHTFAEQVRIEKEQASAILKARRENENLYVVEPDSEPKLIDEISSCFLYGTCRDEEQLKWAEVRLKDLGVEKIVDGRVISYVYSDDEICVYANPLKQKNIGFQAYKVPLKKRSNTVCHHYQLQDRLKNGLKEKFENFILDAKKKKK